MIETIDIEILENAILRSYTRRGKWRIKHRTFVEGVWAYIRYVDAIQVFNKLQRNKWK